MLQSEPEFRTGVIRPVEVYKEAWELMKGDYWTLFAVTLVGLLLGSLVPLILIGPMMCGLYMCVLDRVDGFPVKFDKLFKGFDHFVPGLIVALVIMLPLFAFIFIVYIPMIIFTMSGQRLSEEELLTYFVGVLAVELVVGIVMTILHSLVIFAFPLIADKKIKGIPAIKLSARAAWANKGGIAGLFGVGIVVVLIGYLMLCIGVYLVLPVIIMSTAVAYRKVFPRADLPGSEPPPPNFYQGLA